MNVNRRQFMRVAGSLAVSSCFWSCSSQKTDKKPNILLIYADDLGYGDLSCYGGDIPTPHIDSIARSGIRFTHFYVTSPACTPSRYSLLTGCYPQRSRHGLDAVIMPGDTFHFDPCETILPEYLKQKNYHTAIFGKWHLGMVKKEYWPMAHGFDSFTGFPGGCIDYYSHGYGPMGHDWVVDNEPAKEQGYATELIGSHAVDYIRSQKKTKEPFFIYLAFNAPHYGKTDPADVPPNTLNMAQYEYQNAEVINSLQAPEKYLQRFSHIENDHRRYYAAMVSAMDDQVGRVLETLDELDLRQDTLIWFISDNGGYSISYQGHADNGGLRGEKATTYEGGIRIPAMVSWPGAIAPSQQNDQRLSTLDLVPTLGAITGFSQRLNGITIDGMDVSPLLFENKSIPDRDMMWIWQDKTAVYSQGWKLVNDKELFHLAEDPLEKTDLAERYPDKTEQLRATFRRMRSSIRPYECSS